ncbi:acetyltransferase [Pleurocapsa sp. PCC 7327]|uniref:GNAT family N-acetyltransferase n=1 Tax=Pleurocapsa sp. PCC 7327 TaxID=118163 RepID=UPI00029F8CC5|nr:GNAT family N-acetyltransferase [Pleurocapsa sp. PCC 7327]AFY75511.1 acetyltransferase [Pleurocapsa sp. PCC 7327]
MKEIIYRGANSCDSKIIADYLLMAGDSFFEFILDDLVPGFSAKQLLAQAVASPEGLRSHKNCYVAKHNDKIIGAINIFPVDALKDEDLRLFSGERLAYITDFNEVQDWGSMFLGSIAVDLPHRNQGIGSRLLDWALERARSQGFHRLSLHVWADNAIARRFYLHHGFQEIGGADLLPHPRLKHTGGTTLMNRAV